ncbi:MAG: EhbH [Methanobrevibacter sp.]|nr:EhbH [Methanobrevibacter sp.]
MLNGIRSLIATIATLLFSVTLFDVMFGFKNLITPGVSNIYNVLGQKIAPNMVTNIVFDWRGYDTLGEALILVTAVVVVLLVFGRGKIGNEDENDLKEDEI